MCEQVIAKCDTHTRARQLLIEGTGVVFVKETNREGVMKVIQPFLQSDCLSLPERLPSEKRQINPT